MPRTAPIVSVVTLVSALLVGACAHHNAAATTTVTSGPTIGTGAASARAASDGVAMRLADEICAREATCNHIGNGARYSSEEACMSDQGALAPLQVSRWTCTPAEKQGSFEECLAAIRSEHCETELTRADVLMACRSVSVCGR